MKFLIFFLLPALSLSQVFVLSDTLFFKSGDREDCFIQSVNERYIKIKYAEMVNAHARLEKVSRIYVNKLGIVYSATEGFIKSLEEINNFLSSRQPLLQTGEGQIRAAGSVSANKQQIPQRPAQKADRQKSWLFGIFYIPYHEYSQKILSDGIVGSIVFDVENSGAMIEAHWAYRLYPHLYLTLNTGYNQLAVESHFEATIDLNGTSGYDQQDKIRTFYALIGGKYFITNPQPNSVAAFVRLEVGKQIAFVTEKFDSFYSGEVSTVTVEENREEFLEDINSPWLFELGFGSEYMFNHGLSLFAQIVVDYASVSAEHRYRRITEFEESSSKYKYDQSEIYTRIGFGLNFYF